MTDTYDKIEIKKIYEIRKEITNYILRNLETIFSLHNLEAIFSLPAVMFDYNYHRSPHHEERCVQLWSGTT